MMGSYKPLWPTDRFAEQFTRGGYYGLTSDGLSYFISDELLEQDPNVLEKYRIPITEYLKARRDENNIPILTTNIEDIKRYPVPNFSERLHRVLIKIRDKSNSTTKTVNVYASGDSAEFCQIMRDVSVPEPNDLQSLVSHLNEQRLIDAQIGQGWAKASLTISGLIYLDDLARTRAESNVCFVAMWFSDEMREAFSRGIRPAVESCGFRPVRIDMKEHNNKIDDEIIAEIRSAKFVVSDFSCGPDGARGGVYYEAGFAHGLGIPVIFTVRESDLNRVHFDTRQFSHIVWSDAEDLEKKLNARIRATIV